MIDRLRPLELRLLVFKPCLKRGNGKSVSMKNFIEPWFVERGPAGLPFVPKGKPQQGPTKKKKTTPKRTRHKIFFSPFYSL